MKTHRFNLGIFSGLLILTTAACGERQRSSSAAPMLVMIDTLVLEETSRTFVGHPFGFIARPGGSYLVADLRNSTIHEFSARGKHVRSIGRHGPGPGEFENGPGRIAIDGDSLLAVTANSSSEVIDLRTGELRWSRPLPGFSIVRGAHKGRVYYDRVDDRHRTSVSFNEENVAAPQHGGPFPWALGRSRIIDQGLGFSDITHLSDTDTVAIGFQSSDYIFIGPFGGPFDSIHVPVVARRGARMDLLANITEDTSTASAILNKQSIPWGIFSLPSNRIAYAVVDADWVGNRYVGTMFVSIVDRQTGRACPDAQIKVSGDPIPLAAFRGDTLLVLFQDLLENHRGASEEAGVGTITGIARYFVNTESCLGANGG